MDYHQSINVYYLSYDKILGKKYYSAWLLAFIWIEMSYWNKIKLNALNRISIDMA